MDYHTLIKEYKNKNIIFFINLLDEYIEKEFFTEDDNIFSILHILSEVLLECESNNLRNSDNNKLLCKKIDYILKNDYLIMPENKKELNYLKEEIYSKNDNIVRAITYQLKEKISSKLFFDHLIEKFITYAEDDDENNSIEIRNLFESIVIQLMYIGYPFKIIIKKIEDLLSFSSINPNWNYEFPQTLFPIEFINNRLTREQLNELINNLSFKERMKYIKKFFAVDYKTYYFITTINGISLDSEPVKANNDIVLYNPTQSKIYPLCDECDLFKENKSIIDYKRNVNVSIRVKAICYEAVPKLAKEKLSNFINLLKVLTPDNNFEMNNKQTLILNSKKEIRSTNYCKYENKYEKRTFERSILQGNNIFAENIVTEWNRNTAFLLNDSNKDNKNYQVLLKSIKKYSEGIESTNDQEAVLKFWSALECLFDNDLKIKNELSKFELIKLIIPLHTTISNKYQHVAMLFKKLRIATYSYSTDMNMRNENKKIDIPDSVLKEVNLITNKNVISLKKLALNCHKIKEFCSDDLYYHEKVNYVSDLYEKDNYAFKEFKKITEKYKDDITIIYRLRNQIIHNADSNDITTNFYLPMLKKMVVIFINSIIDGLIKDNKANINQVITKIYTQDIMTQKRLEHNNLFAISFDKM